MLINEDCRFCKLKKTLSRWNLLRIIDRLWILDKICRSTFSNWIQPYTNVESRAHTRTWNLDSQFVAPTFLHCVWSGQPLKIYRKLIDHFASFSMTTIVYTNIQLARRPRCQWACRYLQPPGTRSKTPLELLNTIIMPTDPFIFASNSSKNVPQINTTYMAKAFRST